MKSGHESLLNEGVTMLVFLAYCRFQNKYIVLLVSGHSIALQSVNVCLLQLQ